MKSKNTRERSRIRPYESEVGDHGSRSVGVVSQLHYTGVQNHTCVKIIQMSTYILATFRGFLTIRPRCHSKSNGKLRNINLHSKFQTTKNIYIYRLLQRVKRIHNKFSI